MGASKKGQRTKNVVRRNSLKAKAKGKGKKGSRRSNKKKGKRRTYKKKGGLGEGGVHPPNVESDKVCVEDYDYHPENINNLITLSKNKLSISDINHITAEEANYTCKQIEEAINNLKSKFVKNSPPYNKSLLRTELGRLVSESSKDLNLHSQNKINTAPAYLDPGVLTELEHGK